MGNRHVLDKDQANVSITEDPKGLIIVETKLGKRPTSKEIWMAAANCPQGNVALGRLKAIKEYAEKGYTYKGTSGGVMPTGVITDDVDVYYVAEFGQDDRIEEIRAFLRRNESLPGVSFEATPSAWVVIDDERLPNALPMEGRLVIPDGAGTLTSSARAGSALHGVLLALSARNLVELAITRTTGETETIKPTEAIRVAKAITGKPREVLVALGILEPVVRDFSSAIGNRSRAALVL